MDRFALTLLVVTLPLGTTPMECAAVILCCAAAMSRNRTHQPYAAQAAVLMGLHLLAAATSSWSSILPALQAGWAWVLLVALPPLLHNRPAATRRSLERAGVFAAAFAGLWACAESIAAATPPWISPVDGPLSHHLTLGYALLPPLAIGLHRRMWVSAGLISLGILCAGSSGPLLSAAVLMGALWLRPTVALLLGVATALLVMVFLQSDPALQERVVLWSAGAQIVVDHPFGVGVNDIRAASAVAQNAIEPGFFFPFHAHDSTLHIADVMGWGGLAAIAWLMVQLWQTTDRVGRSMLAALAVGSLTQDTLGDLEVCRAMCVWVIFRCSGEKNDRGREPPEPTVVRQNQSREH